MTRPLAGQRKRLDACSAGAGCGRCGRVGAAVGRAPRSFCSAGALMMRGWPAVPPALRAARGGAGAALGLRLRPLGAAAAGHRQHRAGAHAGRLGDAVDALQLGQRHAVLAGDAVERLARLQGVAPLPAGRGDRRRSGGPAAAALRAQRRGVPARRLRCGLALPAAAGTPAGSTSCWPGLMAGAVAQAVDLDQRRDRHAVALGDAVERVALLHLDGLAAGGRARPVHGPAGVAVGAAGRIGCGLRWRVVARAGVALGRRRRQL